MMRIMGELERTGGDILAGLRKTKTTLRIVCAPVKIQAKYLVNTSQTTSKLI